MKLTIDKNWRGIADKRNNLLFLYNKRSEKWVQLDKQGYILIDEIICHKKKTQKEIIASVCDRLKLIYEFEFENIFKFIHFLTKRGIITTGKIDIGSNSSKQIIRVRKTKPILNRIMLEITKNCNLNCLHCYHQWHKTSYNEKNNLTLNNIADIIRSAEDIGVYEFELTGGEISTHNEFYKIMEIISNSPMKINLYSNLSFQNKDTMNAIIHSNPSCVVCSLDGFADEHDFFRGKNGSFLNSINNLKILNDCNIPIYINITINRFNYKNIDNFIEWLKKNISIKSFAIGSIFNNGQLSTKIHAPPTEHIRILKNLKCNINNAAINTLLTQKDQITPNCGIGHSMLYIESNGNICLCPTLTGAEHKDFLLGNILNSSLKDIWERSPLINKFRKVQCRDILQCQYANECKGGCRSRAFYLKNDIFAPDKVSCDVFANP